MYTCMYHGRYTGADLTFATLRDAEACRALLVDLLAHEDRAEQEDLALGPLLEPRLCEQALDRFLHRFEPGRQRGPVAQQQGDAWNFTWTSLEGLFQNASVNDITIRVSMCEMVRHSVDSLMSGIQKNIVVGNKNKKLFFTKKYEVN